MGTPPMNVLKLDGGRISGTDHIITLDPGPATQCGLRPEALRLAERGLPARVLNAEYLGADTVVACAVGSGRVLARLPGKVDLAEGSAIHLDYNPIDVHLFDAESGRRISAQLQ